MPSKKSGSKSTSKKPLLQFGLRLDKLPAKIQVELLAKGMDTHTAIIAQSGSGKSFMLGRLLEEIAIRTKARFLILDPSEAPPQTN
jgi:DNA helicase HerA-like ATPase